MEFQAGDFIKQNNGSEPTWALVIGHQKNGAYIVIRDSSYSRKPAKASTIGWSPGPIKIRREDVPKRELNRILKHADKLGYSRCLDV